MFYFFRQCGEAKGPIANVCPVGICVTYAMLKRITGRTRGLCFNVTRMCVMLRVIFGGWEEAPFVASLSDRANGVATFRGMAYNMVANAKISTHQIHCHEPHHVIIWGMLMNQECNHNRRYRILAIVTGSQRTTHCLSLFDKRRPGLDDVVGNRG